MVAASDNGGWSNNIDGLRLNTMSRSPFVTSTVVGQPSNSKLPGSIAAPAIETAGPQERAGVNCTNSYVDDVLLELNQFGEEAIANHAIFVCPTMVVWNNDAQRAEHIGTPTMEHPSAGDRTSVIHLRGNLCGFANVQLYGTVRAPGAKNAGTVGAPTVELTIESRTHGETVPSSNLGQIGRGHPGRQRAILSVRQTGQTGAVQFADAKGAETTITPTVGSSLEVEETAVDSAKSKLSLSLVAAIRKASRTRTLQ
jgi:hypothetical protein